MSDSIPRNTEEYRAWWEANTDVPYGYCWCGCGQETSLGTQNNAPMKRVKGEPRRFVSGGHNRRKRPAQHLTRYRIEDHGFETPCWVWTGATFTEGYGRLQYKSRSYRAHRFFYESEYGPLPSDVQLHHRCKNILCVRLDHLQPLSPVAHVRIRSGAKLTTDAVREIRELYATGYYTQHALAHKFGVTRTMISQISRNVVWVDA